MSRQTLAHTPCALIMCAYDTQTHKSPGYRVTHLLSEDTFDVDDDGCVEGSFISVAVLTNTCMRTRISGQTLGTE